MTRWLRSLFAWRTYDETWTWIHQRNAVTGEERHIQKVRGVPMVPPPRFGAMGELLGPIPPSGDDEAPTKPIRPIR